MPFGCSESVSTVTFQAKAKNKDVLKSGWLLKFGTVYYEKKQRSFASVFGGKKRRWFVSHVVPNRVRVHPMTKSRACEQPFVV